MTAARHDTSVFRLGALKHIERGMADEPTVTVLHDDQEITVPLSAVKLPEGRGIFETHESGAPQGFVRRSTIAEEVQRAKEGLVTPDALLDDPDFIKRLATNKGWRLDEELRPIAKVDDSILDELRTSVTKELVTPKVERIKTLEEENAELRRGSLERDIMQQMQAAETRVKPSHLRSLIPGQTPAFVRDVAALVKTDPNTGQQYYLDEEGVKVYDKPIQGVLRMLKGRDREMEYFTDERQRGSDFETNGRQHTGLTMSRADFDAKSHAERQRIVQEGKFTIID